MPALAQSRGQQALSGGNVQDLLPRRALQDKLVDETHVAGEVRHVGEILFEHDMEFVSARHFPGDARFSQSASNSGGGSV